jgi:hypothetical protein
MFASTRADAMQGIYTQVMDKPKLKPFLMRLHPATKELLDKAAADQHRSVSSLIDQCVREQLQPRYGELQPRLQRFLSGVRQP